MSENNQSTITKLERQKKDPKRISIYVDNKFFVGVDSKVVLKFELVLGMIWTEEVQLKIEEEESYRKALKKGFDLLYRSSKTKKQLKRKLIEKEFTETVSERVVETLEENGFINDLTFAEQFIETRSVRYGVYRLRQELRLKGVDDDLINKALESSEQSSEYDRALEIGKKRLVQYLSDPKEKIYSKMVAYLSRKGFAYDVVKKVVNSITEDI